MVKCVLPLILALVSGCAAAPPNPIVATPIEVKVPVLQPVYCPATWPQRPDLPIAKLHHGSAPADTIRAYAASVVLLKGAVEERELLLASCSAPAVSGALAGNHANRPGK
jgi:hypothetical protein